LFGDSQAGTMQMVLGSAGGVALSESFHHRFISLAPGFSPAVSSDNDKSRFNGFHRPLKPLKRLR
jgi:hypothetical protein